jgi:S-formylglutathione hydrolase FrmB
MALVHCDFFSDVLGLSTSMTVILPQSTSGQIGMSGGASAGDSPVLYLLHGLSDDHTIWTRRTSIERYVAPLGLAVVMPRVDRSFYLDEAHGNKYWTFLSEELPEVVRGFFRISRRREDTFVAGLSMGGYGALKWALTEPHRFAAAASLSGAVDLAGLHALGEWRPDLRDEVFGDEPVADTPNDLYRLLAELDPNAAPALSICCGTEDFLIESNRTFADALQAKGLPIAADFGPGDHEWGYWDSRIQDVLAWLPLKEAPRQAATPPASTPPASTALG